MNDVIFLYNNIPDKLKKLKSWNIANFRNKKAPEDIKGNYRGYNKKYQSDFKTAFNAAKKQNKMLSFGINPENGHILYDLDNCFLPNKELKNWAKPFVQNSSYCEYSFSKEGLHGILSKKLFDKNIIIKMKKVYENETDKAAIEIYTNGKNLALTGWIYNYTGEKYNIETIKNNIEQYQNIIQKKREEKYKRKNISNNKNIYDNNIFEEIKNNINIKNVLEYYGMKFDYRNFSKCPFHTEKTPSFTINKDGTYHCYGCHEHGDIIQFVADTFGLSNIDAATKIINDLNLNIKSKIIAIAPKNKLNDKKDSIIEFNKFKGNRTLNKDYNFNNKKYYLDKDIGEGYYLTEKGFVRRSVDEGIYYDKLLTPIQLIPDKLIYINNKEELLFIASNGSNKEKNILKTEKAFTSALNFRYFLNDVFKSHNWFDGSIKDVIGIDKYLSSFMKFKKIERIKASDKFGWKDKEFLPFSKKIIYFNQGETEQHFVNALKPTGDFELWKEYFIPFLDNDIARIHANVSLASILIKPLSLQPFGFYNYCESNRGKSIAQYTAFSIWGQPCDKTITAFNGTDNGFEARFNMSGNLPVFYDDSQHLEEWKRKNIEKLIYNMSNGTGKSRMTKELKSGKMNTWALTYDITGENPLLDKSSDEGAFKRFLEIYGAPFDGRHMARKTKEIVQYNYGFLGPLFLKFIQEHELFNNLNSLEDEFFNKTNLEAHITHIALLALCDKIMCEILNIKNDSIAWGNRVFKKLPTKKSVDKFEYGLEIVKETYFKNPHKFTSIQTNTEQIGFKSQEGVCFYRHELAKILKQYDIPEKMFLKKIKERNIVVLHNGYFKLVTKNGTTCRPIQFKNEFFTTDLDGRNLGQQKIIDLGNLKK